MTRPPSYLTMLLSRHIRRRDVITLIAAAAAGSPFDVSGQSDLPVIGYLSAQAVEATARNLAPFREGLDQAGFVEGRNVAIEYQLALGEYDRLPALAADLIARKVAVIVATNINAAFRGQSSHLDHPDRLHRRRRSGHFGPCRLSQSPRG